MDLGINMNTETALGEINLNKGMRVLYKVLPSLVTSKTRLHRMFLNKCENEISDYSMCLGDYNWKVNIEQFISKQRRINCHNQWYFVSQCSNKNIDKSFTTYLNIHRTIKKEAFYDNSEEAESIINARDKKIKTYLRT